MQQGATKRGGWRKRLFAWGWTYFAGYYDRCLLERKQALFAVLGGRS